MKPITSKRDFPSTDNFVYLNAANVALMYDGAKQAISEWTQDLAENGSNNFDEIAEAEVFEPLHQHTAQLFNCKPEDISVGSSATELLGSLAWAIAPESEKNVVSTSIVFPSTVYPWQRVARSTGCSIRLVRDINSFIHEDDIIGSINKNTAVVCISHVEYGSGQRFDLGKLCSATHEKGALFIVDATQSAGAVPIDLKVCPIDAVISGAYKWLCGPFGAAVMYLAPHLQHTLEPGLVGFRSHKDIWDLNAGRIEYPDSASRFEFSTMAYGCAVGLAKSIDFLVQVGIENIFKYNLFLADTLVEGLRKRNANITSPLSNKHRSSIVTALFEGKDSSKILQRLKDAKVYLSKRGNALRFSPHLYNNPDHIEKALDHIDRLCLNQ